MIGDGEDRLTSCFNGVREIFWGLLMEALVIVLGKGKQGLWVADDHLE